MRGRGTVMCIGIELKLFEESEFEPKANKKDVRNPNKLPTICLCYIFLLKISKLVFGKRLERKGNKWENKQRTKLYQKNTGSKYWVCNQLGKLNRGSIVLFC